MSSASVWVVPEFATDDVEPYKRHALFSMEELAPGTIPKKSVALSLSR